MRHAESRLQEACVRLFRLEHRERAGLLFAVPNGARVGQTQARILKAEGMLSGVSDLILMVPASGYHALCIEMKWEQEIWKGGTHTKTRTYQRPEQRAFQDAVTRQGYGYAVVRSVDEFRRIVADYLAGRYEQKR